MPDDDRRDPSGSLRPECAAAGFAPHRVGTGLPAFVIVCALVVVVAIMIVARPSHRPRAEHHQWMAHALPGRSLPCLPTVRHALRTLYAMQDGIVTTAGDGSKPNGIFTFDPTPTSWRALNRESPGDVRVLLRAHNGLRVWANGWLDPATAVVVLVLDGAPERGRVIGILPNAHWPDCERT